MQKSWISAQQKTWGHQSSPTCFFLSAQVCCLSHTRGLFCEHAARPLPYLGGSAQVFNSLHIPEGERSRCHFKGAWLENMLADSVPDWYPCLHSLTICLCGCCLKGGHNKFGVRRIWGRLCDICVLSPARWTMCVCVCGGAWPWLQGRDNFPDIR